MLLATQASTRLRLLMVDVLGILLVSIYWLMIGQVAASVFNSMFALISGLGYASERWPATRHSYWGLYPLILVSTLLSGGGRSLLAAAGTLFAVVGVQQRRLRRLRVLVTLGALCWLVFGVLSRSLGQVVFGVLFIAGHIRSLVREEPSASVAPSPSVTALNVVATGQGGPRWWSRSRGERAPE